MPSVDHGIADFQPNSVWGSTPAADSAEELTLPSGQTCRAKRMSVEAMIQAGLLAEADAITAMVTKHIKKAKGSKGAPAATDVSVGSLMKDPKAIGELVMMLDRLLPHVVLIPTVRLHFTEQKVGQTVVTKRIPVADREPDIIYTDQIGLEDKMFLFDWAAGGLGSMLAFRQ